MSILGASPEEQTQWLTETAIPLLDKSGFEVTVHGLTVKLKAKDETRGMDELLFGLAELELVVQLLQERHDLQLGIRALVNGHGLSQQEMR